MSTSDWGLIYSQRILLIRHLDCENKKRSYVKNAVPCPHYASASAQNVRIWKDRMKNPDLLHSYIHFVQTQCFHSFEDGNKQCFEDGINSVLGGK